MGANGTYEAEWAWWFYTANFWVSSSLWVHGRPGRAFGTSAVKGRNCPQGLVSPDAGVQLNCLNVSTTWNAVGGPWMFLFQPWWAENSQKDKVTLKCLKWHQMVHCKLLRGVFYPVEETLCVGVRASWGAISVSNQVILCRCHLNNFMSHPRAASQMWNYLLSSPTSPRSKGTSSSPPCPHSSHAAGSKEESTCRGEHWGGVLICLSPMRRAALGRAEV